MMGQLDDFAGRFGHETTHSGKLFNLRAVAARSESTIRTRVHVFAAVVIFQRAEERIGEFLTGMCPDVLHLILALAVP
jgi:hypothetical protein